MFLLVQDMPMAKTNDQTKLVVLKPRHYYPIILTIDFFLNNKTNNLSTVIWIPYLDLMRYTSTTISLIQLTSMSRSLPQTQALN